MADLVRIDEVKLALRYDGIDDDAIIDLYIPAASQAIYKYLKWDEAEYELSGGLDESLPGVRQAKIATICLIGQFLENPSSDPNDSFTHGNFPWFVTAMLYPYRDPTLA